MEDFLRVRRHDFLILPEAHSSNARVDGFNEHYKGRYLMCATHFDGTDEQQVTSGGLAIVFSDNFLEQFDPMEKGRDVVEVVKGRLLLVTLRKGHSRMQIAAVYGATGNEGPGIRARMWDGVGEDCPTL